MTGDKGKVMDVKGITHHQRAHLASTILHGHSLDDLFQNKIRFRIVEPYYR